MPIALVGDAPTTDSVKFTCYAKYASGQSAGAHNPTRKRYAGSNPVLRIKLSCKVIEVRNFNSAGVHRAWYSSVVEDNVLWGTSISYRKGTTNLCDGPTVDTGGKLQRLISESLAGSQIFAEEAWLIG